MEAALAALPEESQIRLARYFQAMRIILEGVKAIRQDFREAGIDTHTYRESPQLGLPACERLLDLTLQALLPLCLRDPKEAIRLLLEACSNTVESGTDTIRGVATTIRHSPASFHDSLISARDSIASVQDSIVSARNNVRLPKTDSLRNGFLCIADSRTLQTILGSGAAAALYTLCSDSTHGMMEATITLSAASLAGLAAAAMATDAIPLSSSADALESSLTSARRLIRNLSLRSTVSEDNHPPSNFTGDEAAMGSKLTARDEEDN